MKIDGGDQKKSHSKKLTRREAIQYGIAGAAGASAAGALLWSALRTARAPSSGTLFHGDAPVGAFWEAWQKRGWVKEGRHYMKLGRNVQCVLCPNNCLLTPGDRSHCRTRVNKDGVLYTLAYGNPCSLHVDPVEKKPLFHFLPGTLSFSLATAGCVFRCLNCQNWEISQKTPEQTKDVTGPELRLRAPIPTALTPQDNARLSLFPEDAVELAKALRCPSISYTYTEPTAFYEYVYDTSKLAHQNGIRNIMVTCGSIEERPLRDLAQYLDAAHVDLKGFDEDVYHKLNSGRLQPILNTLKTLHDQGVWFEMINLIVPTYTDNCEMMKRMCGWLSQTLGPDYPLHFSRFHPAYKLEHLPPTPIETLLRAREIARAAGLRHVYIGNAPDAPDAGTTCCPNCKRPIIERDIYLIQRLDVVNGKCRHCQTQIAGVWEK